jgi:hypothetical protein
VSYINTLKPSFRCNIIFSFHFPFIYYKMQIMTAVGNQLDSLPLIHENLTSKTSTFCETLSLNKNITLYISSSLKVYNKKISQNQDPLYRLPSYLLLRSFWNFRSNSSIRSAMFTCSTSCEINYR